ncbi:chain dehydrogenase/reductase [Anaeramoeba flamelloides]|uniref:3-oxoacyl-[acyl-carrier-protein] reductase n=1 Tax=Anaeramoeba flamelloides TaxID=1746091 RepID=A0ABQ8YJ19_9EUKA|nr:chain dehydrogenase/reductase [Anaeramoeba flamelloides]
MKNFQGKKITLVTSGDHGIGYEVCRHLSKFQKNHVILTSKNQKEGEKSRSLLEKVNGAKLSFLEMDENDPVSVENTFNKVRSRFGKLDVLINNPSFPFQNLTQFLDVQVKTFIETFALNVYCAFNTMKTFLPLMQENKYGRIVNVGSCIGDLHSVREPIHSCYVLTQFSIKSLTKTFSEVVNPSQIKINAIDISYNKNDDFKKTGQLKKQPAVLKSEISLLVAYLTEIGENGPTGSFFQDLKLIESSLKRKQF